MFHFGRVVAFGVDVADFLEFERAFQSQREAGTAAEVQKMALVGVAMRQRADALVLRQNFFDALRGAGKIVHAAHGFVHRQCPAQQPQVDGQDVRGGNLRREGLGAGHADLRPRLCVDDAVDFARDRAAGDVDDAQSWTAAFVGQLHRAHRVGRLAGLADRQHQDVVIEHRVAVAEIRGVFGVRRDARRALDHVARHHARVKRRALGDADQAADRTEVLVRKVDGFQAKPRRTGGHSGFSGLAGRFD